MPHRELLLATAIFVLFASISLSTEAQDISQRHTESSGRPRRATLSGIVTDRLSAKGLQRWKAIEQLIFAEDANGQLLHPTLKALWEWAETSGHIIYIEIPNQGRISTCTAGSFSLERFDPQGKKHVAVVRLHLSNIDQAYIGPSTARADGFIPFEALTREERYAEVLGHELAHAVYILTNQARARMVEEFVEQTNEILLSGQARHGIEPIGQEMRQRLIRRDTLLKELEAQAETMEIVVWRELVMGQALRGRSPAGVEKSEVATHK